jgi:hypothetical protein
MLTYEVHKVGTRWFFVLFNDGKYLKRVGFYFWRTEAELCAQHEIEYLQRP